ncbi:phytanoyl-CoA dioxygenase family protein [uncultured Sphingomonas sp.]|uniref:phytanoyl-CoA dioxygenase family protein n=1 Tax=Sphingomonas sp. 179-A 2A2 NHS TaxID=3374290 RepID=UPI002600C151|nr:phytanoyl-CoA dioxygenase family protein [uncultured Sphingomonas sp.]
MATMIRAGDGAANDQARPAGEMAAARQQLREEGWCVIPDVIDAETTRQALDRLYAAAEASEARGVSTFMPVLDPNDSNVRVFYLLEHDAIFRELICHPLALDIVEAVLGRGFMISNFTANIARPGARSMALHSDQSIVVPAPWHDAWAINIIWCLSDVRFENGATLFIPGGHRWQSHDDVPGDAKDRLRPFEAKAGSIVAMDGRLWHTSGANVTADEERALLFGYYSKAFLRPQVNWNAALSSETQRAVSPELFQLLGLGVTANTGEARHISRSEAAA